VSTERKCSRSYKKCSYVGVEKKISKMKETEISKRDTKIVKKSIKFNKDEGNPSTDPPPKRCELTTNSTLKPTIPSPTAEKESLAPRKKKKRKKKRRKKKNQKKENTDPLSIAKEVNDPDTLKNKIFYPVVEENSSAVENKAVPLDDDEKKIKLAKRLPERRECSIRGRPRPWPRPTRIYYIKFPLSRTVAKRNKTYALNLFNKRFGSPPPGSIDIFTDGSQVNEFAFAAVFIPSIKIKRTYRLTPGSFSLTAELLAIEMALQYAYDNVDIGLVRIFSDSLPALKAISKGHPKRFDSVGYIREFILDHFRKAGVQVQLIWIPGHVGLYGNKRADRLASDCHKTGNAPFLANSLTAKEKISLKAHLFSHLPFRDYAPE